ncbi:MAG: type II secretion system protein [Pseudobdellovibrionaceae bacterium]
MKNQLFIFNHRGFSLAQVLVAGGAIAALSLVFAQLVASNARQQKQLQEKNELIAITTDLNRTLKVFEGSCKCVFNQPGANGIKPTGGGNLKSLIMATAPAEIPLDASKLDISFFADNCSNTTKSPIITAGKLQGSSGLKVMSASLSAPSNLGAGRYATNLTLSVQSANSSAMQVKPLVISQIILNTTGPGTELACMKDSEVLANIACPSGQILKGFDASGNPLCEASVSGTACPTGQSLTGFTTAGAPICANTLSNLTCSTGQFLIGFTSTGAPKCVTATPNLNCSSGQAVTSTDANGNPVCGSVTASFTGISCPSGSYMRGISASGAAVCSALPTSPSPSPTSPTPSPTFPSPSPTFPTPVPTPVPTPIPTPVPPPPPPPLPTYVAVPGVYCDTAGPYGWIVDQYTLPNGRCADGPGYTFWVADYNARIGAGKTVAVAKAETEAAIQADFVNETQAELDSFCPDPVKYKWVKYLPTYPSKDCTIRCSVAPSTPGCAP